MKKRKLFFHSVFSRFSFAIISILFVSFVILTIVNSVAINYYYTDLRNDELAYVSLSAKEEIEDSYRRFKWQHSEGSFWDSEGEALAGALSELTDDSAIFIILTDGNGSILYKDPSVSELPTRTVAPEFLSFDESDTACERGRLGFLNAEHYYCATHVYVSDEYVSTMFVCLSVSVVKQPVNAIIALIIGVSVTVMGIALLISYVVSRRITHPLAGMSEAAKAFAGGDFSVRVPVVGQDEISEFAMVFNEMADNLENIERTRNDFIANVSHDLRSPMTSIHGFIDGMLNGVIPLEKHEYYLGVVLKETKRLSRLVTTLLDISRIQAGERKFVMSHFDICETARQILFSFESRINEKNLDVQFELDEEHMYVLADHDAIYQVLYNLSDNAVKFSRDGGKLVLSVTEQSDKILVSVYNEGEGISEEDLKFVFDRFYKVDKSRGIDKSGTGLGLYITKKIMEAHKETITVTSEYQRFCRFSFTLAMGEATARRHTLGQLRK